MFIRLRILLQNSCYTIIKKGKYAMKSEQFFTIKKPIINLGKTTISNGAKSWKLWFWFEGCKCENHDHIYIYSKKFSLHNHIHNIRACKWESYLRYRSILRQILPNILSSYFHKQVTTKNHKTWICSTSQKPTIGCCC